MSEDTNNGLTARSAANVGEMTGKAAPLSMRALTESETDGWDGSCTRIRACGGHIRIDIIGAMEGSSGAAGGWRGLRILRVGDEGDCWEGEKDGILRKSASKIFKPRTEVPEIVLMASRRT